jgi:hypothetical protein
MTARLSWLHRCIIQWTARLVLATSGGRDIELIPQMPCWVASVQKTECCAIFGPPKIWVFVPRERCLEHTDSDLSRDARRALR